MPARGQPEQRPCFSASRDDPFRLLVHCWPATSPQPALLRATPDRSVLAFGLLAPIAEGMAMGGYGGGEGVIGKIQFNVPLHRQNALSACVGRQMLLWSPGGGSQNPPPRPPQWVSRRRHALHGTLRGTPSSLLPDAARGTLPGRVSPARQHREEDMASRPSQGPSSSPAGFSALARSPILAALAMF